MTEYRRIDTDTFQELRPARRIKISELQRRRQQLNQQITLLAAEKVGIPKSVGEKVRGALREFNETREAQIEALQRKKSELDDLITRLEQIR